MSYSLLQFRQTDDRTNYALNLFSEQYTTTRTLHRLNI